MLIYRSRTRIVFLPPVDEKPAHGCHRMARDHPVMRSSKIRLRSSPRERCCRGEEERKTDPGITGQRKKRTVRGPLRGGNGVKEASIAR